MHDPPTRSGGPAGVQGRDGGRPGTPKISTAMYCRSNRCPRHSNGVFLLVQPIGYPTHRAPRAARTCIDHQRRADPARGYPALDRLGSSSVASLTMDAARHVAVRGALA